MATNTAWKKKKTLQSITKRTHQIRHILNNCKKQHRIIYTMHCMIKWKTEFLIKNNIFLKTKKQEFSAAVIRKSYLQQHLLTPSNKQKICIFDLKI